VVLADLNGDGWPDLAVANYASNTISVVFGTGAGTFGPSTEFVVGQAVTSLAVGDLNQDGRLDLLGTSEGASSVAVLLGAGDGTFALSTYETGASPAGLALGDVNGDGWLDVAVANYASDTASVLLGDGTGRLGARADFSTGKGPRGIAIRDLDGDGRADLAVANSGANTVSVLLGNDFGAFNTKVDFGVGAGPAGLVVGDLDGDGWPELAVANGGSRTVSVLLNSHVTTPVTVEDLVAAVTAGGVRLRWRLARGSQSEVQGIDVERATRTEGPYVVCSAATLEPRAEMVFEDAVVPGQYWYRLILGLRNGSRALVGPVAIRVERVAPQVTRLHPPFESGGGLPIQIRYSVARVRSPVRLWICDVRGRVVWASAPRVHEPGEYTQTWDRRGRSDARVPRGVYFVTLDAGGVRDSRKLALLHR
jgi:hypothetical protein